MGNIFTRPQHSPGFVYSDTNLSGPAFPTSFPFMTKCSLDTDIIFAAFVEMGPVALAVSGGADSLSMMSLFARWRAAHPLSSDAGDGAKDLVLSVDHGLRAEASDEVAFVLKTAKALGFDSVGLTLEGIDPQRGLQAAARRGRYEAMSGEILRHGISDLLTAHTLDDQAETLLMRLSRGSGIEGLRGILPVRRLFGITLHRPLIGVRRAVLKDHLRTAGLTAIEDPSNSDDDYERVRVRGALGKIDSALSLKQGQSLSVGLAESARRLTGVFEALSCQVDDFFKAHVHFETTGLLSFDEGVFDGLPFSLQVMVLQRVVACFGRPEVSLAKVENAVSHLLALQQGRYALKGLLFEKGAGVGAHPSGSYLCYREAGRCKLEVRSLTVKAGEVCDILWDGRIGLRIQAEETCSLTVRAPTEREAHLFRAQMKERGGGELNLSLDMIMGLVGVWSANGETCDCLKLPQLAPDQAPCFRQGSGENTAPGIAIEIQLCSSFLYQ